MIELRTERLLIRDHRPGDLEAMHTLFSDSTAMYYLPDLKTRSLAETAQNLEAALAENELGRHRRKFFWGIFLTDSSYVGEIGYTVVAVDDFGNRQVHLGYFIKSEYWRRGITTEATMATVNYAFSEGGVIKIETGCLVDNAASEKVMQKCGFIREAYKRKHTWLDGKWRDRAEYGLLREEWSERRGIQGSN